MVRLKSIVPCTVLLISIGAPAAQTILTPTFEVASVKPNNSGTIAGGFSARGSQFTATNLRLSDIIGLAYQLRRTTNDSSAFCLGPDRQI